MVQEQYDNLFIDFVKACGDGTISIHEHAHKAELLCNVDIYCEHCEYNKSWCKYAGSTYYKDQRIEDLFIKDLYKQYPEYFI